MQNALNNEYRSFIVLRIKNTSHCLYPKFFLISQLFIPQQKYGGKNNGQKKETEEERGRKKTEEEEKVRLRGEWEEEGLGS